MRTAVLSARYFRPTRVILPGSTIVVQCANTRVFAEGSLQRVLLCWIMLRCSHPQIAAALEQSQHS